MKRFLSLLLVMMLSLSPAMAEETIQVTRQGLELGEGAVHYPQVEGMADAALQEQVNAQLLTLTGAESLLTRLALTMQHPMPLTADYTAALRGDVLSVALKASGPVVSDRATQVWYTANIDLRDGSVITLDDLFTDSGAARLALEEYLEWDVLPALSAHLRNGEVLPLPETFGVADTGLTLYYPMERLATLSDQAGTVHIQWSLLRDYLDLEEGSILHRMGVTDMLTLNRDRIVEATDHGMLPGIPARLGDRIPQLIEQYKLLIDPDLYEGGRMIQLEDGAFRGAYLLTDALTDDWDHSVVQGIRTDRVDLYGLCTGVTTVDAWRAVLGQPSATVQVDDAKAEANRILPGATDYYDLAGVQLRLHADGEGVLCSLFLMTNTK